MGIKIKTLGKIEYFIKINQINELNKNIII